MDADHKTEITLTREELLLILREPSDWGRAQYRSTRLQTLIAKLGQCPAMCKDEQCEEWDGHFGVHLRHDDERRMWLSWE